MTLYRIRDWDLHFENSRTIKLKNLNWVPMPNRMDGCGYTALTEHENAAAHLGVWLALVEIASLCSPRGTLIRKGTPHTPQSIARISRLSESIVAEAMKRLTSPEIGWLEEVTSEGSDSWQSVATAQPSVATFQKGREGKGTEGNGKKTICTEPIFMEFPVLSGGTWKLAVAKRNEYAGAYPAVDVDAELRAACQWLRDNPRNMKTPTGMTRYLNGWLSRQQNRAGRVNGSGTVDYSAEMARRLGVQDA